MKKLHISCQWTNPERLALIKRIVATTPRDALFDRVAQELMALVSWPWEQLELNRTNFLPWIGEDNLSLTEGTHAAS